MSYTDILPTPNYGISDGGLVGTNYGPGFASIDLSSKQPVYLDRTNSNRLISRASAGHQWELGIKYNPMVKEDFELIYSFILQHGQLRPFYVELPQYTSNISYDISVGPSTPAGATSFLVSLGSSGELPKIGDLFNIDAVRHFKTYKITRIETLGDFNPEEGAVGSNEARIHFMPPLTKSVAGSTGLELSKPKIRVITQGDTQSSSIDSTGVYSYSLKLEEAL